MGKIEGMGQREGERSGRENETVGREREEKREIRRGSGDGGMGISGG